MGCHASRLEDTGQRVGKERGQAGLLLCNPPGTVAALGPGVPRGTGLGWLWLPLLLQLSIQVSCPNPTLSLKKGKQKGESEKEFFI